MKTQTIYICEICGARSLDKNKILNCETNEFINNFDIGEFVYHGDVLMRVYSKRIERNTHKIVYICVTGKHLIMDHERMFRLYDHQLVKAI